MIDDARRSSAADDGRTLATGACAFTCKPAGHGLFVQPTGRDWGYFLPRGRRDDERIVAQPHLSVGLTTGELNDLFHSQRPFATTFRGPRQPDKPSNQDFALSAVIEDRRGRRWSFGAVADGVFTGTFWPERAARIACLTSYRFLREQLRAPHVDADWRSEKLLEPPLEASRNAALADLRLGLVRALRDDLEHDRRLLASPSAPVPSSFSVEEYRYRKAADELWYRTTLLVALIGPHAGFLFWSGDGQIWVRKRSREQDTENLVIQDRSGPLERFVWLSVDKGDFKIGMVVLKDQDLVTVALASDGLHRTLQTARQPYSTLVPDTPIDSRGRDEDVARRIESLYQGDSFDNDDCSLVLLEWSPARDWARRWDKQRYELKDVLPLPVSESERPPESPPRSTLPALPIAPAAAVRPGTVLAASGPGVGPGASIPDGRPVVDRELDPERPKRPRIFRALPLTQVTLVMALAVTGAFLLGVALTAGVFYWSSGERRGHAPSPELETASEEEPAPGNRQDRADPTFGPTPTGEPGANSAEETSIADADGHDLQQAPAPTSTGPTGEEPIPNVPTGGESSSKAGPPPPEPVPEPSEGRERP